MPASDSWHQAWTEQHLPPPDPEPDPNSLTSIIGADGEPLTVAELEESIESYRQVGRKWPEPWNGWDGSLFPPQPMPEPWYLVQP